MVDSVVLVTRMATNTIFYRQDHGTSGFKWRKTGFDREQLVREPTSHWYQCLAKCRQSPSNMTMRRGFAKPKGLSMP